MYTFESCIYIYSYRISYFVVCMSLLLRHTTIYTIPCPALKNAGKFYFDRQSHSSFTFFIHIFSFLFPFLIVILSLLPSLTDRNSFSSSSSYSFTSSRLQHQPSIFYKIPTALINLDYPQLLCTISRHALVCKFEMGCVGRGHDATFVRSWCSVGKSHVSRLA